MNKNSVEDKIAAVDLFCGAGGLTYGLRKAGIRVEAGIDIDEEARYAYEKICGLDEELVANWRNRLAKEPTISGN